MPFRTTTSSLSFYKNHCTQLIPIIMDSQLRARHPATTQGQHISKAIDSQKTTDNDAATLLTWDQLPEWAKDNEYILGGFRPTSNSYLSCLKSCFYIHNESGNIYSHFLATVWMLTLPAYFYPFAKAHYNEVSTDDWIIFGLFFLGGAICFALSTGYHMVSNHSHAVHVVYHRLDLLGISTVTAGCFPPGMWYTFPCADRSTKIFWVSVRDHYQDSKSERLR